MEKSVLNREQAFPACLWHRALIIVKKKRIQQWSLFTICFQHSSCRFSILQVYEHPFCISKVYKYSILAKRVGRLLITEMIHLIMYFPLFVQYVERPDTHNGINHEMES